MTQPDEIVDAVTCPGRSITYHNREVERLAKDWPTLARALAHRIQYQRGTHWVPRSWRKFL